MLNCFVGDLGAVVLGRYAQRKLLEYQDKEAAEYLTHFRFRSVFADTLVVVTVVITTNGLLQFCLHRVYKCRIGVFA